MTVTHDQLKGVWEVVALRLLPVDSKSDSAYTPSICHGGYLIARHQNLKWSRTARCSSGTPAAPSDYGKGCGFGCALAKNYRDQTRKPAMGN